jgi:predicted extracellular nuclease
MRRRSFVIAMSFALLLIGFPGGPAPADAVSTGVVISQVYGGGGNSGATYTHDFVELFNRGTTTVSLTGWSIQYASATGTGNFGANSGQLTELFGSLAPGQYVLVQEASTAAVGAPLPAADIIDPTPIGMAAGAGKVALLNTTAALRNSQGCVDTDNNSADFASATPTPRNTLSPLHVCAADAAPSISATSPLAGASGVALDANVSVTFSEPVNVVGTWFTIGCGASGSHTATVAGGPTIFTLDPETNFTSNESCTTTVIAANVTDQDVVDPPDVMAANFTFTFQTVDVFTCGGTNTLIHQVQGSGAASPIAGTNVAIEGVVIGDYQHSGGFSGFYVQEEAGDADSDSLTSEGIFVFNTSFPVNAGDVVRLRGTVTEFQGLTEIVSVTSLSICSSGGTVPPTAVGLPVANVTDLERFEGMLVTFSQTLTATEVFGLGRFGEVALSGAGRLYTPTAIATPGPDAIAQKAANDRSRIVLDDGYNQQNLEPTRYPQGGLSASNTLRVGDTLPGLTGVMDFRFNFYRIQPVGPLTWSHTNPRTAAPASVGGNLKVASFNVLNFFNGDGLGGGFPTLRGATNATELQRQLAKEVSALRAINADIVGLMEIENDAGLNSALAALVDALNAAMGSGTYSYIDTGVIGTDEIKVALIYKPAAVTPMGLFKTITSTVDPRFIDTLNRPSLAQTFRQNASGQQLTVVVNHLKSKSSACAGDPDTGDGQGNCNLTRTAAAAALADWLATDPTGSGDPDFLIIGDLNAYTFEDPIAALTDSGYTNLTRQFGGLGAYSYVFMGESGYLDHALGTSSMAIQVTGVTDWHINPDEPTVLDYNLEFKSPNQQTTFYDSGPYRSSDHDPVIVGIQFNTAPTANAGGPYAGVPFGPITFSGSATDPDGALATLRYEWDFDYNGTFAADDSGIDLRSATHAYAAVGTYTVALRVTDAAGDSSAIATATVSITLPPMTDGKIEGTPKWGDSIKTKINIHSTNGEIKGRIEIEGDGWIYQSTRFDSVVVTGADATVHGAFGTVTFRLDIHDGGADGTDTLRLRVSDGYDSGVLTGPQGQITVFAK